MKKINYLASLILTVIVLGSCANLNKMKQNAGTVKYDVVPKVLETNGGEVAVTITGSFPEKFFLKKAIVEATPVLTYEGGETAFESVTLQGEDVQANNKVISFTGGTFDYSSKVPFNEDMKVSELVLRAKASMKDNSVDFDPVKLADGVIATSTYVCKKGEPILIGDKFKRIIPEFKEADIHYVINLANVRGSELKQEDINALKDYIKASNEKANFEFTGTEILAYASPDGPFDFNEELSGKRSVSAESFIDRELKRVKVEAAKDESFISKTSTPEDWEGFKELMEESQLDDKDLILRVLSMHSDPVVREREIKNIAAAYTEIAKDILPKLRRSKIKVNVDVIGFSDEEIGDYVMSNPDTLNLEEVLYAATLTKDLDKKLAIYRLAAEKAPNCYRAWNNIGYTCMHLEKVSEAKEAFEKAKELKEDDAIKNNLGYVAILEGDLDGAENYFNSVASPGKEVNCGLGIINIIRADYEKAITYFGTEMCFNAALAKLLNGDSNGAKRTLDNMDVDEGWVYYLKAIVGARVQDEAYMFDNLRSAVGKEAELKETAKKDMEFGKYFENDTFKSIVE
jgi:tetratricopeptide (TPR) repeat protein